MVLPTPLSRKRLADEEEVRPARGSQGAKLAAQQAVGSLGMRGVRRKHAPARETARFQKPPRAGSRPSTPLQGEGSGVRSAPERLQIDSGFEVTGPGKIKARCSRECHPSEPPCATSRRSERVDRATAGGAETCAPESAATPPRRGSPRQRPHHASTGCLVARSRVEAIVWLAWPAAPRYAHFLHRS